MFGFSVPGLVEPFYCVMQSDCKLLLFADQIWMKRVNGGRQPTTTTTSTQNEHKFIYAKRNLCTTNDTHTQSESPTSTPFGKGFLLISKWHLRRPIRFYFSMLPMLGIGQFSVACARKTPLICCLIVLWMDAANDRSLCWVFGFTVEKTKRNNTQIYIHFTNLEFNFEPILNS